MKIAIATKNYQRVSGHVGQTRHWLLYDLAAHQSGTPLPAPSRIELCKAQLFHHCTDDAPHPLDGVDLIVSANAGDGFVRHMRKRGAAVLLTGESDPAVVITQLLAGDAVADPRFDISTSLCKLRDLFSRH
jgi:predicted Fe-Mo cluster-binding NifX family protein